MQEKTWTPPRYRRIDKDPWIPTETEIDQLIAGSSPKVSTFLQLLKETGMRPGEAWTLKWIDINTENSTVSITPEKGSNPRTLKLSSRLLSLMNKLEKRNTSVFNNGLLDHFAQNFRQQRKAVAWKLNNPRIRQITFKTFRHFKATMDYHKTKDILHVKYLLGHRRIENTLIYTHLVDFGNDEYVSKVAKNASEACQLVELGYDFVCNTSDGLSIFRKRK
jgi:integrase